MLYEKLPQMRVRCSLCAHRCSIADGKQGVCHVRENQDGTLYTMVYGRTIIQHVDPVEKKPLLHFHPGSTAYSIATPGCNFQCRWCQNWDISQVTSEQDLTTGVEADPEQVVAAARTRSDWPDGPWVRQAADLRLGQYLMPRPDFPVEVPE